MAAITRENEVSVDDVRKTYCGTPILERPDWSWVLSDAATRGLAELWIEVDRSGPATIRKGRLAPIGVDRAFGSTAEGDAVWTGLAPAHGNEITFRSAALALVRWTG